MQERVRGLSVQKVKGSLEDKQAGENVCTFPVQDPAGAMGWECLERLQEKRQGQSNICRIVWYKYIYITDFNYFVEA